MKIRNNHDYKCRYRKLEDHLSSKRNLQLQKWLFIVLIILLIGLLALNTFNKEKFRMTPYKNVSEDMSGPTPRSPAITPGYLVYTEGCRIPAYDPLDPTIIGRFIKSDKTLKCDKKFHPRLVESNETAIFINYTSKIYYYEDHDPIRCCWSSFQRAADDDKQVVFDKACNDFEESATIKEEFIRVKCWKNSENKTLPNLQKVETVFRDYFAFVPTKPLLEKKLKESKNLQTQDFYNVLIVGLDSVSRMNIHRQMPKTIEALEKLSAIEMLGYTKVGDNTYPNIIPLLTGMSEKEFEDNCWQDKSKTFDDCPFLWKNFSEKGYKTIFGEDACWMSTFNYLRPGFRKQPTDYYLRPYCVAGENDIGNTHNMNADICVGSTMNFVNLLHYTKKVATKFVDDSYFAFFWEASLTHDYFDYPRFGDEDYSKFIHFLDEKNLLKKTVLIFMSDHGMRWGPFRETALGKMEGSLPFSFLVLPDKWKRDFPTAYNNLKYNSRSLTTPYDLHETLQDLLETNDLSEEALEERANDLSEDTLPRGISWFLPIPDRRDCDLAYIPDHYCQCHETRNVSLNDSAVTRNAHFLVNQVNKMLENYSSCAVLKMETILDAKMWSNQDDVKKGEKSSGVDYTVTLKTTPGSAIFEGTFREGIGENTTLLGDISRLNAYGQQSACIDNAHMRMFCFCT